VRVIVASTNQQLGIMKIQDALRAAQAEGLDLVEVAPNANPPVCRIVDYGKYRYELAKQEKDKKTNATKLKEIKFRVNIDEHDYLTKLRHAEAFLDKSNKVRVNLQFRGREMAHQELGDVLMTRIKEDLATMANVEMQPKKMGRNITMVLSPLPAAKRKRKFLKESEEIEPEEDESHDGDDE
jgi:translation initiation factor IF-3